MGNMTLFTKIIPPPIFSNYCICAHNIKRCLDVKVVYNLVFYPKFGSWVRSFLTQRRRGAEKTARFEFFESYLLLCNPTPSTPDG